MPSTLDDLLAAPVSCDGVERRFGELSAGDAERQAAVIGQASTFGHRSRAGGVAAAWRELASRIAAAGGETVADLDAEMVRSLAERLWIVPPGGSILPGPNRG